MAGVSGEYVLAARHDDDVSIFSNMETFRRGGRRAFKNYPNFIHYISKF